MTATTTNPVIDNPFSCRVSHRRQLGPSFLLNVAPEYTRTRASDKLNGSILSHGVGWFQMLPSVNLRQLRSRLSFENWAIAHVGNRYECSPEMASSMDLAPSGVSHGTQ